MKRNLIGVASLLLLASVSRADELPVDSTVYLQGVVVTANKINVNRNSVPLSISVIDRQQIEASSESALLPVLSQYVPNLFVTAKGITGFGVNNGSGGTVNIRGVGQSNKVLMLFDGQPQWAGIFGHSLPDTYVASDVEKVEVIRGPGSLLYGSNAMGGVVNIITRDQLQDGRRTQARLLWGSYGTQKYMVNNGYKSGKFSSFVSLNHDRTDGHRVNNSFHITNGFGKIGYEINENLKATADVSVAKFFTQNPGSIYDPVTDYLVDVVRGTTSFALENNYGKTSGALRVFYNWGNHEINDGYYGPNSSQNQKTPREFLFRSLDHNTGVLLYQSFRLLPGNSFTVGIDYKNWGGEAWNKNNDGTRTDIIDKTVNETAAYLIMQQDLFDKVSINAGVRYEHNEAFGGEWVPQVGVTYRPIETNVIKASLSKGFRSPNIRELYMYEPVANAELNPESMLNYEVSVGQSFLDGKVYAEVTGFFIDGKDMIQAAEISSGGRKNMNVGSFINKGIEVEGRWHVLSNLHLDANYSYLHTSKPINFAPKHKLAGNLTYQPGRFTIHVNVLSVYDFYPDNISDYANMVSLPDTESFTTLNAKVAYLIGSRTKGINLFLKGENLTATRYEYRIGYPMPKAVFMAGLDITF
ncbi:MAG: TonB-dependent receptor [Tannerellaceae bacterium]|nr:TonB-dependent receptor [Tannerellaceae bacterium]